MRTSTVFAPLFLAATTFSQAVPEGISPDSAAPSGCKTTVETPFRIGTLENPTLKKRESSQEASDGDLLCTLEDGILHDQYGRTGAVVANRQFQFDGPPQAGSIYTGGWSVCGNNSLAMGGSTRWWRCMSGAFGNLYDESIGAQCHEIRIQAIFPETSSSSSSEMMSSTTSSALSGSTSILFATSTSGLSSESRSIHPTDSAGNNTAFSTATAFSKTASDGASATSGRPSSTASPTGTANAPPASGVASASMAPFAMFGVSMVFLGAALML